MNYKKISPKNMKKSNLIISSDNSSRFVSLVIDEEYDVFFSLTFFDFLDRIVREDKFLDFYDEELDNVYERTKDEKNI